MTEGDLRAVKPFDTLPVEPKDAADDLCRPSDPKFQGTIYEAGDVPVVKDLLRDPQLVPRGAIRDEFGAVRAIFWQLRSGRAD